MSFEGEHRNNINNNYPVNNYPVNNRRNNVVIENRIIRCSFCNCFGHNIKTCNDPRINEFEEECQLIKTYCIWTEDPRNTFKEWIMVYSIESDISIVRAFAISKCNCRMNTDIDVMIDRIAGYIYEDPQESIPFPTILSPAILSPAILSPAILTEESMTFYMELEAMMSLLSLQNDNNSINDNNSRFNITAVVEQIDEEQGDEICECAICYDDALPKKNFVTLNCKHQFCKDCFKSSVKNTPHNKYMPTCALCRADISEITVHDESVKSELADFITK
jgi:hypothetical protein